MQLEKASTNTGEAGMAGWISTNDVTLFTMVLVVLIALLLNSNLLKKSKQLDSTSAELGQTQQELGSTQDERDSLDAELASRSLSLKQTREKLRLTQEDRDQLNKSLEENLAKIVSLNAMIAGLTSEKSQLQSTKQTLEQSRDALTKERNTLTKDKASLNDRLAELAVKLEAKVNALGDVEKQKSELEARAKELDAIVATLRQKLDVTGTELADMRKQSATTIKELQQLAAEKGAKADDYLARLRRAAELFKGLKADKATLTSKLTDAQRQYQEQLRLKTQINRELVGIRGDLKRVAILFDASGSMKERGTGSDDRWADAVGIAKTWLQHLDVDECVLIVFSSDVRTFPPDGTLANLRGDGGETARAQLLEPLTDVEPKGWTNTLEALRKAYSYDGIDTIILFSDGAPTNPNLGTFDDNVARQIYALCREHDKIPINSVGLGNYFDQNLSTFLRTVARLTGGTFRGR